MATNRKQPPKPAELTRPAKVPDQLVDEINAARVKLQPAFRALQDAAIDAVLAGNPNGDARVLSLLFTTLSAELALVVWRYSCERAPNADPGVVMTHLMEAIAKNALELNNQQLAYEAAKAKGQTKQ